MAHKPAAFELKGGKSARQRVWEAVRGLVDYEGGFTLADASRASKVETGIVAEYFKALHAGGYLGRHDSTRRGEPHRYWLARDNGIEAPRLRRDGSPVTMGLAQEQMWRTLRLLKGDTNARELAAHASTQAVPVAESAARDYLRMLDLAGYLDVTAEGRGVGRGRGKGGTGLQSRYRLKADRNTGPKPPMVCRTKVIFDPNLCEVVWAPAAVTEEDADHVQ